MKTTRYLGLSLVFAGLLGVLGSAQAASTVCLPIAGGGMQCDTYATKQEAQRASQQAAQREEREWANHRKAVDKAMQDLQATQDRWCNEPGAYQAYLEEGVRKGWWSARSVEQGRSSHKPSVCAQNALRKDPREALQPVGDTRGAPSFQ